MIYDIQSKNDMISGASLVVKIPEEDLDKKALYTLLEEPPDFILPFRCRTVDGQIEFVYKIGTLNKIQYLAGDRRPEEYSKLWSGLLTPLLECNDWFLKPYSFVLDIRHLYCDKNKNAVCYVYIPSKKDSSGYNELKEMAVDFTTRINVTSPDLENKVLRSLMMDFNPKTFLSMLKSYCAETITEVNSDSSAGYVYQQKALPAPSQTVNKHEEIVLPELSAARQKESSRDFSGDIYIDITSTGKRTKKSALSEKGAMAGSEKNNRHLKNRRGFAGPFGNAREIQREEIIIGDARPPSAMAAAPQPESGQIKQFSQIYPPSAGPIDITQSISCDTNGAWLRLVGSASLPPVIDVVLSDGEIFTVGRYDSGIGRQQSGFEFDKNTKAVSRRHAAIERGVEGYNLIDLSSSAGTFVDGQRLPPNTPFKLQTGCRVSFGNCGADYIWQQ